VSNPSDYQFHGDDRPNQASQLVSDAADAVAASFPFVAYHGVTGAIHQQKFNELSAQATE